MKFNFFPLMPYPYLPEDFDEQARENIEAFAEEVMPRFRSGATVPSASSPTTS